MSRLTTTALDAQLDLLRYYTNDPLGRDYSNLVVDAAIEAAQAAVVAQTGLRHVVPGESIGLGFITHRTILGTGETYAVTSEIVEVLQQAAPSMPTHILHADDLPSPHGFVWLETPIVCPDVKGRMLVIKAFGWQRTNIQTARPDGTFDAEDNGAYQPSAIMLAWTDPDDPRDHMYGQMMADGERPEDAMGAPHGLLSMIAGIFPFEGDWTELFEDDRPDLTLGRFWMTLLRFLGERWIGIDHVRPDRHQAKRAVKRLDRVPTIKVIHLRRAAARDSESGDGNVEWTHRWIVRGHWRNQWYPALGVHKPRWIAEYVKGPEGAPLIVHDKIFSVER